MSNEIESEENKKSLTRDAILSAEEISKTRILPSGAIVRVKYLTLNLVKGVFKQVETVDDDEKGHMFSEKVVLWMLRDNEQRNLNSFTEEDQRGLIEVAVDEWGCREEYDEISDQQVPEQRFYRAACKQEEDIALQLSESLQQLTSSLTASFLPMKTWQEEIASSLRELLEQFSIAPQISEAFNNINLRAIDQICDIGKLSIPIANLAGSIDEIRNSIRLPYENSILADISGSISSYQNLMRDVLPINKFSVLPDAIRYYPTIEMHNTSVVTGRLLMGEGYDAEKEEVITPDNDELLAWLGGLDPSFPNILTGAEKTIYSENPDRCRHFASSHRELCTHILNALAPDDAVKGWTANPNHFHENRPTRKARLLYIVRNYKNVPFVEFFVKDFSNQMDLLNADEHRKNQDYDENELLLLHERFLSALGFLKEIISNRSGSGI